MNLLRVAFMLVLLASPGTSRETRVWRAVVHVHSRLSHDSRGEFSAIAQAAREAGAEVVFLTDHPGGGAPAIQPAGEMDGVTFIPGLELHHMLALGVTRLIDAGSPAEAVDAIHRAGGLAIAAHPATFNQWNLSGLDGMEVYDILDNVRDGFLPWTVARWVWRRLRDPDHAFGAVLDYPAANLVRWDGLAAARPFAAVAGVDAHENTGLRAWRLDPYARQFGIVQTWILSARPGRAAWLDAIRRGRTMIVFTLFGDPGEIRLTAASGGMTAGPGETLALRGHGELRCAITRPARVRMFRDGKLIVTRDIETVPIRLAVPLTEPGFYRAELWTLAESPPAPWVLTGGITVRPSPGARTH